MARAVKRELTPPLSAVSTTTPKKYTPKKQLHRVSPFPSILDPTPAACEEVNRLLTSVHYAPTRPSVIINSPDKAGCGSSTSILDGLIRTILSQNTTNSNADNAFKSLNSHYGGESNYSAVLAGTREELEESIRCGGLAGAKSKAIFSVLEACRERAGAGELNLEYLREMGDEEVMNELLSFKGVGPKTASCVLLFAMGRDSFAVDTHIWRITKSLGWVPEDATRDKTFSHLDVRIPAHLKYPLHTLLVLHGRSCENCTAGSIVASEKARAIKDCPIKHLLTEPSEKKKGKGNIKKGGEEKRKVESEEEEEEAISSGGNEDYEEEKPKIKKGKGKSVEKVKREAKPSPKKKVKISESEVESELSELEEKSEIKDEDGLVLAAIETVVKKKVKDEDI